MNRVAITAIVVSIATFALNSSAIQSQAELPFEPAYAAEQKEITFDSLAGEIRQFEAMAQWHRTLGEIEIKRQRRDALRSTYERGLKLYETKAISQDEMERREWVFKISEGELAEQQSRAHMIRLSVESIKYGIMMKGDPTVDYRKQIAGKMKESLGYQMQALRHALNNAMLSEAYLGKRAEDAKQLADRGAITPLEYARIRREHMAAKLEVGIHTDQIQVISKAIEGMNKSLKRLFSPP